MKRPIRLQVHEMVQNQLCVFRFAIGRQPHHLIFTGIDLESGVVGKSGIEQAQRMWKMDLPRRREMIVAAQAQRRRGPFTYAVHRQNGCPLKRRSEKGRSGMTLMMLREK